MHTSCGRSRGVRGAAPVLGLLLLGGIAGPPCGAGDTPAVARIRCTPDAVQAAGGAPQNARNPIALALGMSAPGALIEVAEGVYPPFSVGFQRRNADNAVTSGGAPGRPVIVRGIGRVCIRPRQPDGGDTIAFSQQIRNGHITFENLRIEAGYRAAVIFTMGPREQVYEGFRFLDCDIDGGWDAASGAGRKVKWGVWSTNLKDFEFRGVTRTSVVENIREEHGFYLHNARGDALIENVLGRRLGRTFCQFTARAGEGAPGVGTLTVRNCRIEDACIAPGDDFKGGSALTLAGRHTGTVVVERVVFRAGFDDALRGMTKNGKPYGTGAMVVWDGHEDFNGTLVLRDNDFRMAPGCGDRPLVVLGACREIRIEGRNRFQSGGRQPALDLDPPAGGKPASRPVGRWEVSKETVIEGPVRAAGRTLTPSAFLAERAR